MTEEWKEIPGYTQIGRMFGATASTVRLIITRQRWDYAA